MGFGQNIKEMYIYYNINSSPKNIFVKYTGKPKYMIIMSLKTNWVL